MCLACPNCQYSSQIPSRTQSSHRDPRLVKQARIQPFKVGKKRPLQRSPRVRCRHGMRKVRCHAIRDVDDDATHVKTNLSAPWLVAAQATNDPAAAVEVEVSGQAAIWICARGSCNGKRWWDIDLDLDASCGIGDGDLMDLRAGYSGTGPRGDGKSVFGPVSVVGFIADLVGADVGGWVM